MKVELMKIGATETSRIGKEVTINGLNSCNYSSYVKVGLKKYFFDSIINKAPDKTTCRKLLLTVNRIVNNIDDELLKSPSNDTDKDLVINTLVLECMAEGIGLNINEINSLMIKFRNDYHND